MNDYISLRIDLSPVSEDMTDLLAAFLCDIGYDSFELDQSGMTAYIPATSFDESAVKDILAGFPFETKADLKAELVKGEDWNAEWEKNYFKPIVVGGECVVHSSFHKDIPDATYDILIDPKMAFGTGHHSTTSLMMRYILNADIKDRSVIDMGAGTGILSILAKMRGASAVMGIEIDRPAWENAIENCKLNNVDINMICGDASALPVTPKADMLFANINRNIILGDIDRYAAALKSGAQMFLSGFYEKDVPMITEAASRYGLYLEEKRVDNDWCAIRLRKN